MKIKHYLVISIAINILLSYIILKKEPNYTDYVLYLSNKVKAEHKAMEDKILNDSLRITNEIKIRDKKINKLYKIRDNERNLYQLELSKIQLLNSDSSYVAVIDSIKKVCCTDTSR